MRTARLIESLDPSERRMVHGFILGMTMPRGEPSKRSAPMPAPGKPTAGKPASLGANVLDFAAARAARARR